MGLRLLASGLRSRQIRRFLTSDGIRRVNARALGRRSNSGSSPGAGGDLARQQTTIQKVINFVGGVFDKWKSNARNISKAIKDIFIGGVQRLLFFDWNQTDAALQGQIKARTEELFSRWGEFAGYTVCAGVTLGVTAMVPKVGPIIAQLAAPDVLQEVKDQLIDALKDSLRVATQNLGTTLYMNIRSFLRNNELIRAVAKNLPFGNKIDYFLEHWGSGKEPWTIYGAIEKQIDKISNEKLRAFAEGAFEGCLEGYFETVAIVAMSYEDYVNSQVPLQQGALGSQRALDIEIDPESDRPPIRLAGRQQVVYPTAQLLIQQEHLLAGREIGDESSREEPSPTGRLQPLEAWLMIFFERNPSPPWNRQGEPRRNWRYKIPNPKRGLSHSLVRRLAGGSKPVYYGKWQASAKLESGYSIFCRGSSKQEAEDRLSDLLKLSSEENWAFTPGHEVSKHKKGQAGNTWVQPDTIQCYPRSAKLIRKRYLQISSGTNKSVRKEPSTGRFYKEETEILEIWREEPPTGKEKFTIY